MQKLITPERVLEEVRRSAMETLRVKEEQVRPGCSFVRDLGLESLDFLDINYRLEQTFGIKMARHFFLEHVEEMFGEGTAIDPRGKLTEKALALLKMRYAEENLPPLDDGLDMDEVPSLITVQSYVDVVLSILDSLPENCTVCGAADWKTEDGTRIVCNACGTQAVYKNGDDLIKEWLAKVQQETNLFGA